MADGQDGPIPRVGDNIARGRVGERKIQTARPRVRQLVHLATAFVRQPHARVPLRGYLFLVLQHGCDVDSHGRWP